MTLWRVLILGQILLAQGCLIKLCFHLQKKYYYTCTKPCHCLFNMQCWYVYRKRTWCCEYSTVTRPRYHVRSQRDVTPAATFWELWDQVQTNPGVRQWSTEPTAVFWGSGLIYRYVSISVNYHSLVHIEYKGPFFILLETSYSEILGGEMTITLERWRSGNSFIIQFLSENRLSLNRKWPETVTKDGERYWQFQVLTCHRN